MLKIIAAIDGLHFSPSTMEYIMNRFILITTLCLLLSTTATAQTEQDKEQTEKDMYYIGVNPIAPFTGIRSEITSLYLPIIADLEAGGAISVGKIMNQHYNFETRLSFGSPRTSYTLLQIQSGLSYCFNSTKKQWHPYAGMFVDIYSLDNKYIHVNYASLMTHLAAGNRFIWKSYFLDLRLNEYAYGLSWTTEDGGKAMWGFHQSLYKWHSPYVPYIAINIGYLFK